MLISRVAKFLNWLLHCKIFAHNTIQLGREKVGDREKLFIFLYTRTSRTVIILVIQESGCA